MNVEREKITRLEALLAGVLDYGTWLASAVIGVGLVLALVDWRSGPQGPGNLASMRIVTAGIALFILLPVLRVVVMLIVFVRERDYRFIVIAALVLLIILAGFAVGLWMKPPTIG